eukprot:3939645-Rhodomonas_salina.1
MEGKKSAWGAKPPQVNAQMSTSALPPKKGEAPPRQGAGTGPGQMHQPPASVSGPDGGKGRGAVPGYRKPDGAPIRRKEISPGKDGFVEELYTTRLDPEKLSEQQRKEAARIAAEIEEERNRKAGGRGPGGGFSSVASRGPRGYSNTNWEDYEDDEVDFSANEPPPPVNSATAFPALDSRPPPQGLPQTSAPIPNPVVPNAQKQMPGNNS